VLDLKHIRFYIGLILYFVVNGHLAICIASALFTGWSYSCDLVMFKHLAFQGADHFPRAKLGKYPHEADP
jgi:hypothetical protein